jgi:hypothetical protein
MRVSWVLMALKLMRLRGGSGKVKGMSWPTVKMNSNLKKPLRIFVRFAVDLEASKEFHDYFCFFYRFFFNFSLLFLQVQPYNLPKIVKIH